jgi:hypothetical protein
LASGPSDPDLAQRVFVRNEDDALPDIILAVPETKPGVFTPCILAADPADFTEQFMTESAPEEPRIGCNSDDTDASTEHIVYTGSISFRIMPLLRSDTDVVALDPGSGTLHRSRRLHLPRLPSSHQNRRYHHSLRLLRCSIHA